MTFKHFLSVDVETYWLKANDLISSLVNCNNAELQ